MDLEDHGGNKRRKGNSIVYSHISILRLTKSFGNLHDQLGGYSLWQRGIQYSAIFEVRSFRIEKVWGNPRPRGGSLAVTLHHYWYAS
jgi:hypothetical protein